MNFQAYESKGFFNFKKDGSGLLWKCLDRAIQKASTVLQVRFLY
ncbi:hypothetical protein J2783_001061 [Chryseobacterium sediminis]|nr:hypothetical protein [Chryseobacterium sediminis]